MSDYDEDTIRAIAHNLGISQEEARVLYERTTSGNKSPAVRALQKVQKQGMSDAGELDLDPIREQESYSESFADNFAAALSKYGDKGGAESREITQEEFEAEVLEDEPSPDAYPEETPQDELDRQVDYFNGLRAHVSDADMFDPFGSGPQADEARATDREMTKIVEALQREAMVQGQGSDVANLPIGDYEQQNLASLADVYQNQPIQNQMNTLQQGAPDPQMIAAMQRQALQPMPRGQVFPGIGWNRGYGGGNPYS